MVGIYSSFFPLVQLLSKMTGPHGDVWLFPLHPSNDSRFIVVFLLLSAFFSWCTLRTMAKCQSQLKASKLVNIVANEDFRNQEYAIDY